jgi:hypothetical protein
MKSSGISGWMFIYKNVNLACREIRMKRKNTVHYNPGLLLCFICLAWVVGCKVKDSNPTGYSYDQNKVVINVPDIIDADYYGINVSNGTYTITYYETAKSKQIMVDVPSDADSQVLIDFYKDNAVVNRGTADVSAGQLDNIKLELAITE